MRFQDDEKKSRKNLAKHGLDFLTAELVFDDPYGLTMRDAAHDEEDERYITLDPVCRPYMVCRRKRGRSHPAYFGSSGNQQGETTL
jgi:uncharacterized DUF497 family protein